MRLKTTGNPTPETKVLALYRRTAEVAVDSGDREDCVVGEVLHEILDNVQAFPDLNATDEIMQSLARFEKACRRIREEMRGIHS